MRIVGARLASRFRFSSNLVAGSASNLAALGFGARISAWRHFKGCRADVYRGYHGGLPCRSSLIPRAVITFPVSGME